MKVAILGGGISGLAAGYFLRNAQVTIFEKSHRVGGWLSTDTSTGFLFERGPRTFKTSKCPALLDLIEDLGLMDEVIFCERKNLRRFLWKDGQLRRMPAWTLSLMKELLVEWKIPPSYDDETIYDFACRRFGKTAAWHMFDPMTLGIHAGDMHNLSIKACFPSMKQWEEEHGSLTKGMWKQPKFLGPPFVALKRGVQSLVDALEDRLRPSLRLGTEVQSVTFQGDKVILKTSQGFEEFDYVISALPCHALGKLLFPELLEIEMKSATLVHLGYTHQVAPKRGFGYIVSSLEKHPLLGVIFDSMAFPQHNRHAEETRLTAFVRGTVTDVLEGLRQHLGIEEKPAATLVTQIDNAFPQMTVGHTQRMHALEKKIGEDYPRLKITGNFLYGVGVSDCITAARSAVENLLSVVPS